jgi:hypothetical protein
MRVVRSLSMVSLTVLAGCKLSSDLPTQHLIGLFEVEAFPTADGNFATKPYGIFFNQVTNGGTIRLPDSHFVIDSCRDQAIPTAQDSVIAGFPHVDAGSPVEVQIDNNTAAMVPDTTLTAVIYELTGDSMPIAPGSRVTFRVPGATNGFPASSITTTMSNGYALGNIELHPQDSLTIVWSSPAGPGSGILLELKYASDSTRVFPDREIYCAFTDDGEGVVPQELATLWDKAPESPRIAQAQRWVTTVDNGHDFGLVVETRLYTRKTTFP